MTGFWKRQGLRAKPARKRRGDGFEPLETRAMMSGFFYYAPSNLAQTRVLLGTPSTSVAHPIGSRPASLSVTDNQGKILTGVDRQGNQWQLIVHGPGYAIVTDATPNDGSLDDDLDTIQLVGTDLNRTYVTGQVIASPSVITNGTVVFNRLISENGVKSIVLNGFTLAQTVPPVNGGLNNTNTGIYLPGGVGLLQFHDILAPIDLATDDQPINIVIGQPNSPLTFAPIIRLDSIFNTVFDSSQAVNANGTPVTSPTVNILVNGELRNLTMISSTAAPIPAAFQFAFPTVGTTGRTAVRAVGVGNLKVAGTARNFTVSRGAIPFQNGFSGVTHLRSAQFGGTADAVGLDVNGPIGSLRFAKGLGDPAGALTGATHYGLPDAQRGYPSFGLLGGLITATRIGRIVAAPTGVVLQTPQDPTLALLHPGTTRFLTRPGWALTNVAITSDHSIGKTTIVGNQQSTEIKSGFNYASYAKGLEGTRAPSVINHYHQRGDLIDSVISATYRPTNGVYGAQGVTDVAGPGAIRGKFLGRLYTAGAQTALNQRGVGFFARRKSRDLPQQ
jgi:hypothetical protein